MNMLATIVPKSNQLSADDLIDRTLTITVSRVQVDTASDQPVMLHFENDGGNPYFPCKSMRRVLVHVWGPDAKVYAGRSMTLYRDPDVQFGGLKVGGIRISHMTHLEKTMTMALTATRCAKKAFTVRPLQIEAPPVEKPRRTVNDYVREKLTYCQSRAEVSELVATDDVFKQHGQKPAILDLIKARMDSFGADEALLDEPGEEFADDTAPTENETDPEHDREAA